ncbi:hypothetical protein SCP_0703880 [Sparassis crispa]|uniref:YTH domain-containing protein n=1 Tax=Sparassis crispa TaxID=139825 RepID=A0A401GSJ0_9APHY|nr:hypothetical protein SCP_0703880 [Sparassis crispa]GBE85202.1 hypothetical protein SCP_0703880 [Sparassis crispa]
MSEQQSSGSTSEPGRPGSRGRSHSQPIPSRRQPNRQTFQSPTGPLYPPPASLEGMTPAPSTSTSFQSLPPQYQTPYGQQPGPYAGQYTLSPQPPMLPAHQSPPYAYPHHPGLHAPDSSMHAPQNPLLGYSQNTLVPIMQSHPHSYPYHPQSPEGSSSPSHSFSASPGPQTIYSSHPHSPAHPSPPPHPPLAPQGPAAHSAAHSTAYAGQTPYAPARYPTPSFAYPPHSFAPSPSVYMPHQYPPYPPAEQDTQGTWWYLPHAAARPSGQYESFQNPYALSFSPVPPRDVDPYAASAAQQQQQQQQQQQPGITSTLYPMSPRQNPVRYAQPQPPPPPAPPADPPAPRAQQPEPGPAAGGRPARRPYRPNPPAQRSEWVMWAGNVPSDATHDELWRFLNSTPPPAAPVTSTAAVASTSPPASGGVRSIFLIARSNCAFVNFQSEAQLQAAIRRFNGAPLRAHDARCPRLVCRVRGREDDLRAGVGGQRGAGMHVRWIRDRKVRAEARSREESEQSSPSSPDDFVSGAMAGLSVSSDAPEPHSSSSGSGSYASTSSSMLVQYFPKRYFILKSLTQHDLDLSVEKGVWATQHHNEGILDQAFRTSKEVYLIFGVNKSGEFYGYAKMAGPIQHGEFRISWASRADSPQQQPQQRRASASPPTARHTFFSPGELQPKYDSPQPVSPPGPPAAPYDEGATPRSVDAPMPASTVLSAPAELQQPHHRLSRFAPAPGMPQSLDTRRPPPPPPPPEDTFELDSSAPYRAMRGHAASAVTDPSSSGSSSSSMLDSPPPELGLDPSPRPLGSVREEESEGPAWGESFKVEWLRTERLPFYRTRQLRNPWNHDREVKVSRDGTELEPSVGQALLDEWDRPDPPPPPSPASERRTGRGQGEGA